MANRGLLQAAGSWSMDACCAVHDNGCYRDGSPAPFCNDRASSSDWLFGLWPGPPQRFEPIRTGIYYQNVWVGAWPEWGDGHGDLAIGGGAPGDPGYCSQGPAYRGTHGEICGGERNWGATDVEVWYPR